MKSKIFSLQPRVKGIIVEVIFFLLVLLFLYASASKLVDMKLFHKQMFNQPFPHWLAGIFMWLVPGTELVIVALFALGGLFSRERLRTWALYASLILMSLFTLYTATILLHFFPRVPCSCGGVISKLNWSQHMVFNAFFVIISIIAIRLRRPSAPLYIQPLAATVA